MTTNHSRATRPRRVELRTFWS